MNTTASAPRRLRLTLGVMMILVLALGGGMGWIAYRARVQREAVAAILKTPRAYVRYHWQPRGRRNANAKPPGPKWLRDALGADVFDTVVEVIFPEPLADQSVLRDVGRLDRLEWLAIVGSGKPLSPESIASIGSLHRLKTLRISGVPNREALFPYLAGMPDLVAVDLDFARPTDADMAHLSGLMKLERINFDGRSITNIGFAHLSKLKALKYLRMPDVKITTLEPLRGMSNLEELMLTRGRREDGLRLTSLEPLRGKIKLKTLMLGWNPISDEGMEGIGTLTSLTLFQSDSAYFTAKSMDQLRKAPNLVGIVMRGEGSTDRPSTG